MCQVRRAGRAGGYLLPVWIRAAAWSAVLWIRQAGGVIRCSLCSRSATSAADQGGVLVPDVLRIRQGGGRGSGKKKQAGRAVCGVFLPAVLCAAAIFPPRHRSTECRRGAFHAFPGRYFVPRQRGQILHFTG